MYEKLIERLREYPDREETAGGYVEIDWQDLLDAADAIESLNTQLADLQSENGSKDREIERMKDIMRQYGIMVIPSKYPGSRSEWNVRRGAQGEG